MVSSSIVASVLRIALTTLFPLTGISKSENPIAEKTSIALDGHLMVYTPFASVKAPVVVPLIKTFAKGIGGAIEKTGGVKIKHLSLRIKKMDNKISYESLLSIILPKEIFTYFDVLKIDVLENAIHVYVDEKNILPYGMPKKDYHTKGFHPESIVQDFPLRDKPVFIHVRRRKWQNIKTMEIVSNTFKLTSKGTRYSSEFASFLKGIIGYLPD